MGTYFRLHPEDEDPRELLDPENQVTEPWGHAEEGKPCDKCGGSGRTMFHPLSGAAAFEDECPTCKGTGKVCDTTRRGVSVFPEVDGLYLYMLRRDADMQGSIVVELEGEQSGDVDFDADEGALLVCPTKIIAAEDLDQDRIKQLQGEVQEQAA